MKIYNKYLIVSYLKYFVIIFFALEFFYVLVDMMVNFNKLPKSANLQVLYVGFNFLSAISYILPLSLIFSMIAFKMNMIKSNELLSLYSLGYSKNDVIKPIFLTSFFIILLYILLNFTSFAYSYEYKRNILNNQSLSSFKNDLFLKHKEQYIYIKSLNPFTKQIFDIKIFNTKNNLLLSVLQAKDGSFEDDFWHLNDVKITNIKEDKITEELKKMKLELKGYKPKIIENLYQGNVYISVIDAIEALIFFKDLQINTKQVRSLLYALVFFPLFAPLMIILLYYYLPIYGRFFNQALVSFALLCITLCSWGFLFVLTKFTYTTSINPEAGIILPIISLVVFSFFKYKKNA